MEKLLCNLLFLSSAVFSLEPYASAEKQTNINSPTSNELLLEESFIREIGPEISKAIKDYYGEGKLFYLLRITNIKKDKKGYIDSLSIRQKSIKRSIHF